MKILVVEDELILAAQIIEAIEAIRLDCGACGGRH